MNIDVAAVARLFDLAWDIAEQLEHDPDNHDLRVRYRRAAARARRAQRDYFHQAVRP